ncbi:unnamed protein product [Mesocestoides corti]|uniref:Caspase-2 n=1 Tax=Mesocestoides corti TaxID=53468 RepID=A0A0R3UET6_MESCO|nr:unnamed protein product [Mesocestoides corti]
MNPEHVQHLSRMQVDLVRDLNNIEAITDYLVSEQILSRTQAEQILSQISTSDKTRSLLNTIVRCGPDAYQAFVSALSKTDQLSLVEKLATVSVNAQSLPPPPQLKARINDIGRRPQSLAVYPVTSNPRGYILLVNVSKFKVGCGLNERVGSLEDVSALQALFSDIGYCVEVLLDPDFRSLDSSLKAFIRSPNHNKVDAGGLIVMSHGLQDYIYTSDGKLFAINDILNVFTNKSLPALAGKPKFILFQACRGEEKDRGCMLTSDVTRGIPSPIEFVDAPTKNASWKCLPYMSDCVIAYSTLPGFVSWRCEKQGSWFIQVLVDVFRKYASTFHVLELLTEVNRRMVEESQHREFKQITQPSNTLTRAFYLSTSHFSSI